MSAAFEPVSDLPAVATDDGSSYAFLYRRGCGQQPHLLVYEVARDFLSVPKTFAVVQLIARASDAVELNSDPQDTPAEPGIYRWWNSPASTEADPCHLLLVTPVRNFESLCHQARLAGRIYHAADSGEALMRFLQKSFCDQD